MTSLAPKLTDLEVAQKAEQEGLGYFVQHYTDGEEFASDRLRTLHKTAQGALSAYDRELKKILADRAIGGQRRKVRQDDIRRMPECKLFGLPGINTYDKLAFAEFVPGLIDQTKEMQTTDFRNQLDVWRTTYFMTYFQHKNKSGLSLISECASGVVRAAPDFVKFCCKHNLAIHECVSANWSLGGRRGGSCWGGEPEEYESEEEPEFTELQQLIRNICDYLAMDCDDEDVYQIMRMLPIIETESSESDYYGNYSRHKTKTVAVAQVWFSMRTLRTT